MEKMKIPNANGQWLLVTPQLAEEMLESNTDNRKLRESVVSKYARDMKNGNWRENGEPIVFDERGILVDGQHRLHAVIKACCAVWLYVLTGVKETEATLYDKGLSRTTSDIIRKSTTFSAIAKMMFYFSAGTTGVKNPTDSEIIAFASEHEEAIEFAEKRRPRIKSLSTSSVWAAIAVAYEAGYPMQKLERFCKVLATGESSNEDEISIVKTRNRIMSEKGSGGSFRKELYLETQRGLAEYESGKRKAGRTEYYRLA